MREKENAYAVAGQILEGLVMQGVMKPWQAERLLDLAWERGHPFGVEEFHSEVRELLQRFVKGGEG